MSVVIKGSSNVNLDFTTGGRIIGDFSNATVANRVAFQTSTVNGGTAVSVVPNGTGTFSQFSAYTSADPTNSSVANVSAVSGSDIRVVSGITGTGTYLPLNFYTGGSERVRIDTSGRVGIGGTPVTNALLTLQFQSGGDVNTSLLSTAYGVAPSVNFRNAGGTVASPTASSSNPINFVGATTSDGTTFFNTVSVVGGIESTPTTGSHPTFLAFNTTPSGSTSRVERMRITSGGDVGIGTASPSYAVDIRNASSTALRVGSSGNAFGSLLSWDNTAGLGKLWTLGAYDFVFGTNGTERMRIDSSGNVGIGTSSPGLFGVTQRNLSITAPASNYAFLQLQGGTGGTGGAIDFGDTSVRHAEIASLTGSALAFYTNATNSGNTLTERARIDSSGRLLVGTTSGSYKFQVQANAATYSSYIANQNASPYGLYIQHNGASPNGAGNEFITCWDTTANRFRVNSNGGIANFQANDINLSDRREKTNFSPAKSYLETICAIPVQTFNYADQNMEEDPGLTLGVVAQDVQTVAPELVMESNWGTQDEPKMRLSIYQTDLQYALMKAIQELKAMNDTLTARVAQLEAK